MGTENTDLAFAAMTAIGELTSAGTLFLSNMARDTKEAGGSGEELWDLSRGQRSCARKLIKAGLVSENAHNGLFATELGLMVADATAEQADVLHGYSVETSMRK